MYLPDSFYNRCDIKIPSSLILDMDNKYDLPVYITLCLAYAPFCKEPFSVKRVLELSRMFRSIAARNKSMMEIAASLIRLRNLGYIQITYCNGIPIEQDVTKSRFLFRFIKNEIHGGYLSIRAMECDMVLDAIRMILASECKCSLCTLLHTYCLFRLNSYFWQNSYADKYAAWVGGISEIYKPLGITQKSLSEAVRAMREHNIITVCYGSVQSGEEELRTKTIVIFNIAITGESILDVITRVKKRYNISEKAKGSWYPPNSTVANNASNGVINKAQQCAESTNGGPNGDEFLSLHAEA